MRTIKPLLTPLFLVILATLLQPLTAASQEKQYWVQSLPVTGARYPLMVKDAVGNIYIETPSGPPGTYAFSLIKYNSSGTLQWTTSYNNPNNYGVISIGVDNFQNVYVAVNLSTSAIVIKFSSTGELLWINGLPNDGQPIGNAMTVDSAGNSYITGVTTTTPTPQSVTVKLNSSGVRQWVTFYIGPAYIGDGGYAITVDGPGNVYVAAKSEIPSANAYTSIETLKIAPNGDLLWVAEYPGSATSSYETPIAIAVDTTSGNVYVVGQNETGGTVIGNVVAYSPNGTQLWAYQDNTSAANIQVMVDYSGNVITVGDAQGSPLFTATKYTPAGSILWNTTYTPSQGVSIQRVSAALDISGNLYVTMPVGITPVEYCTQEYYSDGTLAWTLTYNAPANGQDIPTAIALQNPERRGIDFIQFPEIFVTGTTTTTSGNSIDLMTVMYSRPSIFFLSTAADSLTGNAATLATPPLAQLSNYPNPFRGATTIAYTIPHDSHVTLQIYDGAGRSVATLVDEDETAGTHLVPFNAGRLATGAYAYRITALSPQGTFTQTKQMIIE